MAVTFKPGGQAPEERVYKEGRSAVLYGPPLSGKTSTLQYDASIRVLLIDLDKNSSVLEDSNNVDVIGCGSYTDYISIKEGVRSGSYTIPGGPTIKMDYDLYAIDSFTRFEETIKEYVATEYAPERRREIKNKFGAQTDWQDLQDHEVREVRDWQSMTRRSDGKPVNVLWIGHDMDAVGSDEFNKKLQLRLQGKYAAPGIMGAVDAVFYMSKFPNEKNPQQLLFGIHTLDSGAIQAEVRLPVKKRLNLPRFMLFPKWGEIFRLIGATNLPEVVEKKK